MKKTCLTIALLLASIMYAQEIAFDKLYSNSDAANYSIGHYVTPNSDGLKINWYGGIRMATAAGTVLQVSRDGNIGIGTTEPVQKLDVSGNIMTGASSGTEGINALAIRYVDGSLNNWGSLRSSASTYMSFGVKSNPTNLGWLSSNGTLNWVKAAITLDNEGFKFMASPAQQTALNAPVNMNELLKISPNGNASLLGKLEAKEIKITHTPTADFVFESTYDLPKLEEVEKHIKDKKHLPEIASAKTMEKEGVNIGSFQIQLLQKVEELTLYSIDQNKQLKQLKSQNENQQQRIEQLEAENTELKKLHKEVEQLKKQFLTFKSTH
ncbi:hypothetical protein [Chryseobacterium indologenes]|uniref:hypothetical protein n=1 Tax=Chryseobacterium indologenes TaxID=253 RepID=UPI001D0CFA8C|nr:hypothetical protein [Chryseobacterium indologenes]UDQ55495.1 hypothetical protein LJF28_07480 [Chryseobacterium indologenes]